MATKLKIEKRGDEIKKKNSPLKLLSPSQPNFAEMILGWSPSKVWLQLAQWFLRRRFLCEFPIGSYVKLSSAVGPSWSTGRTTGHIFGREPSNDYFIKI
jgi:hypothetical protein